MHITSETYRQDRLKKVMDGYKLKDWLRYSTMSLTQIVQQNLGSIYGRP